MYAIQQLPHLGLQTALDNLENAFTSNSFCVSVHCFLWKGLQLSNDEGARYTWFENLLSWRLATELALTAQPTAFASASCLPHNAQHAMLE